MDDKRMDDKQMDDKRTADDKRTDDSRAQTLQALEAFIQTQKNLLSRQQSDIERLRKLRIDFVHNPTQIISNLGNELGHSAFRISEQADSRLSLPKDIEWPVFDKSDTGPLRTFAQTSRDRISHRSRPSPSDLSELQQFVKQARRSIVDPILARFADISSPEPESEDEVDPIEQRRRQEHEKIRQLKNRKIHACGLSLPLSGTMGVIIRSEVDDDAMDVDVSIDDNENDDSVQDVIIIPDEPAPLSPVKIKPPRVPRRPPKKTANEILDDDDLSTYVPVLEKPRPPKKVVVKSNFDVESEVEKPKRARGTAKPKPETYKQAWSESEQNLLEQLLEQIPDGERFRWQKISRAMGGRRTPRQVASRVQKYFEKLKRFGVDS